MLLKFFSKDEFTDDYLKEELELTQVYLKPLERESIQKLLLERSPRGDIRRAADYFKLIRYSFSGGGKVFGTAQRRPLGGAGERSETEGRSQGILVA